MSEPKNLKTKKIITGISLFLFAVLFAVVVYYFPEIKSWLEIRFKKVIQPETKPQTTNTNPPKSNPSLPTTTGNSSLSKTEVENLQENLNALNNTNFSPVFGTKPNVFPLIVDGDLGSKTKSALAYFGFDNNGNYLYDMNQLPVWFLAQNTGSENEGLTWYEQFFAQKF